MSGRGLTALRKAAAAAWMQQPWRQVATGAAATQSSIRFDDSKVIFQGKSTGELIRGLMVFRMCGIPAFVNNAEFLLKLSTKIFGEKFTSAVVKHTFFAHFCAGEDGQEVWTSMNKLRARGVGAILDYAAEDDAPATDADTKMSKAPVDDYYADPNADPAKVPLQKAVARVYDYYSEQLCDKHVDTFLDCVSTAGTLPGQGFAAVKVTALGNPQLLKRVTKAIRAIRKMFKKFDLDGSGFVDKEEFDQTIKQMLQDSTAYEREHLFQILDTDVDGRVDYISWCQQIQMENLPFLAERIHKSGATSVELKELQEVCLDKEEVKLVHNMEERLHIIARKAVEKGVKLMIDAEHSYFQPAIDHLSLALMKEHNKTFPYIYNTYQAYLKDSLPRLLDDMERADREGYMFGCKLVRGAYLHLERNRAEQLGYNSPVWDTLEQTHQNYSDCLEAVLARVQTGPTEILLGTHNQPSIEQAVRRMNELGIDSRDKKVSFGQLLGMADHLTFTLGQNGYPAYKYVPYGQVHEVIPYLLRRASENADMLKGAKLDVNLHQAEIKRRLLPFLG